MPRSEIHVLQIDPDAISSSLDASPAARVLDQDPPHRLGGSAIEVGAIGPGLLTPPDEPDVGFVHESSCLQRVVRSLAMKSRLGQRTQLIIDHG